MAGAAPVSPRDRYQHSLIGRFRAPERLADHQQDPVFCWLAIADGLNQALFCAKIFFLDKGGPEIQKLAPMGFQVFWGV